jgi:hypothetical protein
MYLIELADISRRQNLKLIYERRSVELPSGAHDQIFVFCLTIAGFLMCGTLSDERMGL